MELFNLHAEAGLSVGEKVSPLKFKDVLPEGGKEADLEDLIVCYPSLLNLSNITSFDVHDLLIISRQPRTQTRKRADLFAVSTDGALIIIEIKRDAEDEKGRREAMEFQAIRYAAASRKMSAQAVIEMFSEYLASLEKGGQLGDSRLDYRRLAVDKLCEHLADEDEELDESDLEDILDPRTKQRIYLVAAGYEPDVLSACAWLREHEIDIACFRLRPYKVSGQLLLDRERLIPPPELDEFLVEMRPSRDGSMPQPSRESNRRKSDKPKFLNWSDEPESQSTVAAWNDALAEAAKKALALGLSLGNLPMNHSSDGSDLRTPLEVQPGLHIEAHASANLIRQWICKMLRELGKEKGFLRIETRSGFVFELPE